ncbi:hypothetical protein [Nonomuraea sp. NPDC003709]|uniref:hypothetical protein n=1 Tax=Nonomuraea sp. NPDC003709 TaxID=3154450 RepID=UPI0033A48612
MTIATLAEERAEKLFEQFEEFDNDGDGMFDQADIYMQIMWLCMDPWNAGKLEEVRKLISASNQMWPELSKQRCIEAFQAPGFIDGFAIPFQLALFNMRDLDSDGRLSLNDGCFGKQWRACPRERP